MIEYTNAVILPGDVPMMANERTSLPCGCCVWVGIRIDNKEAATGATPCSAEHLPILTTFNELLIASVPTASREPLIEVCDRFLGEAEALFNAQETA